MVCYWNGQPVRSEITGSIVGPVGWTGTVGVHHVDFKVPISVCYESNLAPIGRPLWRLLIMTKTVGQARLVGAVGVSHIDLIVSIPPRDKRERTSVGRPR